MLYQDDTLIYQNQASSKVKQSNLLIPEYSSSHTCFHYSLSSSYWQKLRGKLDSSVLRFGHSSVGEFRGAESN